MSDLWQEEGFGGAEVGEDELEDNDWDEGEESIETTLEDEFDDPAELEPEDLDDEL